MTRIRTWWPWMLVALGVVMLGWAAAQLLRANATEMPTPIPIILNQQTMVAIEESMRRAEPGDGCSSVLVNMPNGIGTISIAQPSLVTVKRDPGPGIYVIEHESPLATTITVNGETIRALLILPAGMDQAWSGHFRTEDVRVAPGDHRVFFVASIDGGLAVLDAREAELFVCPAG